MRSPRNGSSVPVSPLDNAFSPAYLAHLREQDESLTAAEAELAGPWKIEPVPGKPGAVAVLREWEDLAAGDRPVAVLWHEERAQLLTVLLPALDREPLLYIKEGETSDGYPLTAVYGEQGPQVAGWLDRSEPRWAEGLHILEAILRSPWALATLLEAAGPGAEEQVGKIRARRQRG
ncbi:MAG TPA: hypothetical protein VFE33_23555 [Thermoanaerobaculia bacterium]|nr:hypothetical protein [Thermoanaerobaculia bacterium]